uniref:Uncharacterized protein n=1 Tax=viral metagenome TaxID=1070528 RepID=A0A6H1ZXF5_9ZZZZ
MNYRHATILANEDLGVSGTKIIDIDIQDPISRITLVHQPVGGSTTILGHPALNITKLELIDGSEVLYSLSGKMGQALNVFNRKHPIVMETDYRVGGTPLVYIDIEFGRFLWDPLLAFDPKKFTNPQLKITWNEAAYDASVSSHGFIVFGHVFDEKRISPIGFLSAKEIKSYVGAAAGYEYTDLPTDYPFRKLILQGELAGSGVRAVIQDIRISEDNDKRIPIDGDIHELRAFLDEMAGDCVENIRATVATTSTTLYCLAHNLASVVQSVDTPDVVPSSGACSGGRFWAEMQTAAGNVQFTLRGQNPHGCIAIPFGYQKDLEDWYDVAKIGSLKLRLLGGPGAASSTTRIALEQLRRY